MANEPWDTLSAENIGKPICEREILESSESMSESESELGDDAWWTPESYFAAYMDGTNPGVFDLSIVDTTEGGTFVATVTLQRSFDAGLTWHDVETFTEAIQKVVECPTGGVKWRLGITEGDYTSGGLKLRLSQV